MAKLTASQATELSYWVALYNETKAEGLSWADVTRSTFARYCSNLDLTAQSLQNLVVVDVGCGPCGSLHHFDARLKFGVDTLARYYAALFPIQDHNMTYLGCPAEAMPFLDNSVDVVLSVNSLDHVASVEQAIGEIYRILKTEGRLLAEINLREVSTLDEPQTISEDRLNRLLDGLFQYRVCKRLPQNKHIPCERVVVEAIKAAEKPSPYQEQAAYIQQVVSSHASALERQMRFITDLGTPPPIAATTWIDAGFFFHQQGNRGQARKYLLRGILANPSWIRKRGVLSVLVETTLGPQMRAFLRRGARLLLRR